jgi:hypothetical protein
MRPESALALSKRGDVLYAGNGGRITATDTRTGRTRWHTNMNGYELFDILPDPNGHTIYLGGDFSTVDGARRRYLAAMDANTGRVTPMNANLSGYFGRPEYAGVTALALSPDGRTLYVGGDFRRAGGKTRRGLAAVDTRHGAVKQWNPSSDGYRQRCRAYAQRERTLL